jgi:uncharacterized protein YlzI (FlbEa/FlbD family)
MAEGKMANFLMLHQCCVTQDEDSKGGSHVELEPIFVNADLIETITTGINSIVQMSSGDSLEVKEKPGEIIELIQGIRS